MPFPDGTHCPINFKPPFVGNGRLMTTQGHFLPLCSLKNACFHSCDLRVLAAVLLLARRSSRRPVPVVPLAALLLGAPVGPPAGTPATAPGACRRCRRPPPYCSSGSRATTRPAAAQRGTATAPTRCAARRRRLIGYLSRRGDRAESFRPPELLSRRSSFLVLLVVASRPAVHWRRRSLDRVHSVLVSISEQAEGKEGRICSASARRLLLCHLCSLLSFFFLLLRGRS